MFNFHKPRVYRSADGCCICRAKSSSSRFTASRKYEKESMLCFNLHEPRNGEICNACVLLVKRYKRLPAGSKRHWGHVVDARAGPGTKSLAKQKQKRENESEARSNNGSSFIPEKFAKIFKKNRKGKITAAVAATPSVDTQSQQRSTESSPHSEEQPSDSNESLDDEQQQQQQQQQPGNVSNSVACPSIAAPTPYQTRKRTAAAALATITTTATTSAAKKNPNQRLKLTGSKRRRMLEPMKHRRAVDNVPFFEEHDLLRLDVCCGTVFQSLVLGSACYIIDPELYKPCEKHRKRRQLQLQQQHQQQQQLVQLQAEIEAKPMHQAPVSQSISTPALKKHLLYFKRQSESFPQGEIHRISPIPLNKTEAMPNSTIATVQQQHSTASSSSSNSSSSLSLILKPTTAVTSAVLQHNSMITTTAVGAASPSSLSSSSNCSTSSSVATKFNDNSSDSGFDEHVLERKSVSPPTQDELQLDKKLRAGNGMQRLILASGLPTSGQTQNLVLTGNEFTARFVQRQQQQAPAAQALKINVLSTGSGAAGAATVAGAGTAAVVTATTNPTAAAAAVAAATTIGSQSSSVTNTPNCNKMRAIFNNANTIQHENGVTTILPASSLAASNQTAAMNAIAPSTVTITPAKKPNLNSTVGAALVGNPKFILIKPALAKIGAIESSAVCTEVKIA